MKKMAFDSFCILVASIALSSTTEARAGILSGPLMNPANGHSYYLLTSASWTDSQLEASGLGGNLVTINDEAEDTWVFENFATANRMLWLGLNDVSSEGLFTWISGESPTYSNWADGEPQGESLENWVAVRVQALGPERKWIDWQDNEDFFGVPVHGVVEVEIPEPATILLAAVGFGCLPRRYGRSKD